jgi:hypothetical protein
MGCLYWNKAKQYKKATNSGKPKSFAPTPITSQNYPTSESQKKAQTHPSYESESLISISTPITATSAQLPQLAPCFQFADPLAKLNGNDFNEGEYHTLIPATGANWQAHINTLGFSFGYKHRVPSTWESENRGTDIIYYPHHNNRAIWLQRYSQGINWSPNWQYRKHKNKDLFLFFPPAPVHTPAQ